MGKKGKSPAKIPAETKEPVVKDKPDDMSDTLSEMLISIQDSVKSNGDKVSSLETKVSGLLETVTRTTS